VPTVGCADPGQGEEQRVQDEQEVAPPPLRAALLQVEVDVEAGAADVARRDEGDVARGEPRDDGLRELLRPVRAVQQLPLPPAQDLHGTPVLLAVAQLQGILQHGGDVRLARAAAAAVFLLQQRRGGDALADARRRDVVLCRVRRRKSTAGSLPLSLSLLLSPSSFCCRLSLCCQDFFSGIKSEAEGDAEGCGYYLRLTS